MASTVPHSLRQARDNTILDLQAQLKEVGLIPFLQDVLKLTILGLDSAPVVVPDDLLIIIFYFRHNGPYKTTTYK